MRPIDRVRWPVYDENEAPVLKVKPALKATRDFCPNCGSDDVTVTALEYEVGAYAECLACHYDGAYGRRWRSRQKHRRERDRVIA